MSRSYRKPYCAITGTKSAADDKKHAARGVRRAQNQALKTFVAATLDDWDEFIMPVKLECSWNDTWGWGRDGKQSLQFPPVFGQFSPWPLQDLEWEQEWFDQQMKWYRKLFRK